MSSILGQNSTSKTNSPFSFRSSIQNEKLNLDLPFTEHVEELRQRSFHILAFFALFFLVAFVEIKPIVEALEIPVANIKFFSAFTG